MTAEIQFEQQFEDVTRTRAALQRCEKQLASIPRVLDDLCALLRECTMSLDQVITSSEMDEEEYSDWSAAKARYLAFSDGPTMGTFTKYFQREVMNRLDALRARSEAAYTVGKERRDAREKFLKNTTRKTDPEKTQKKKEVFCVTDNDFADTYNQLNMTRSNVAGAIARNFFLGYSSVTFAIANALCSSQEFVDTDTLLRESIVAARTQPVSAVEQRGYRPAKRVVTPIETPTKPAAADATSKRQSQRRLSDLRGGMAAASTNGAAAAAPGSPARQFTTGIPIYYDQAPKNGLSNVEDALPNDDEEDLPYGVLAALPRTTSPDHRSPTAAGAAAAVATGVSPQAGAHGQQTRQQTRRSTASTLAHFYGSADLETAGAAAETGAGTGTGTGPSQSATSASDGDAEAQYRDFFQGVLGDNK